MWGMTPRQSPGFLRSQEVPSGRRPHIVIIRRSRRYGKVYWYSNQVAGWAHLYKYPGTHIEAPAPRSGPLCEKEGTSVNAEEARGFIGQNHRAVLATYRRDGGLQMSPVTAAVDAEGYVTISSRETAYKVKNLLRDHRAAVCVFTDSFFGPWVQVEGVAHLIHLPEAMEGLVDYYRRASGEHPDWEEYRAAMVEDARCLIRIAIERAAPNVSG